MVMAAIGMGACIIEKHLSFNRSDKRSFDCPGSVTPEDINKFVDEIRELDLAIALPPEERENSIETARKWANQSAVAAQDIPQGSIITKEMVAFKRPGTGVHQKKFQGKLLGKTTKCYIEEDSLILEDNVQ